MQNGKEWTYKNEKSAIFWREKIHMTKYSSKLS